MGEIVQIQPGSVAEKAGLIAREVDDEGNIVKHGDRILEVDNEPVVDPLWLPYVIFSKTSMETQAVAVVDEAPSDGTETEQREKRSSSASSRTVLLTIQRDGQLIDLPVSLPQIAPYAGLSVRKGVLACDSLGIAYNVTPIVSGIDGTAIVKEPFGRRDS